MRQFLVLSGLTIAFLCGCAGRPGHGSAPHGSQPAISRELRVMSFNLRVRTHLDGPNIWDKRRDLAVERVRAFDPDLLGTQEGWGPMEDFLRGQLSDYTFFGAGRSDGIRRGEMCGVFFKTARFAQLDGGHFWLSRTPDEVGSHAWGEINPRIVTWVKLQPRDGRPPFYWYNTHFDAWVGRARTQSARLLRERMNQMAGSTPCIVTGDFNASAGSVPYRTLLADPPPPASPLNDVFRDAHPLASGQEGTYHFFTGLRSGRRMDWILATLHFQTVDAEIDRARGPHGYPSDHFPVTAVLRFHSRPRAQ